MPWLSQALLPIAGQEAQQSDAWRAKSSRTSIKKWKTLENTTLCSSSSSPSLLWDRSCTSFFKFLLLRKQGLLGLFSCCQLVRGFSSLVIGRHW